MPILTTDAKFKRRVAKSANVDREDLWKELHEIASFLALIGRVNEALDLWRFVYSGIVPMPDPDDRTISVFGDSAVSAMCYQSKLSDISIGNPPPMHLYLENGKKMAVTGKLKERVVTLDHISRQRITGDNWYGCKWDTDISPKLAAMAILRKSRIKAQPSESGNTSRTEKTAYSSLTVLIDETPVFQELHPCDQAEGLLLAADLASRHNKATDAIRYLQLWHDISIDWDYNIDEVFGLIHVAGLIAAGALSGRHSLSQIDCREIVENLIQALTIRLSSPEARKPPIFKHKLYVSYGQFYLEPLKSDPAVEYFQEDGEAEQGFTSFPRQVAFCTPGNCGDCHIKVEFAEKIPSVKATVQAVVVPLIVDSSDGLYLRTVNDSGKKYHLEIPTGKYDVMARFYPIASKQNTGCDSPWRAVLTFLPSGTMKARCLKLAVGIPPSSVCVHG